MAKVLSPNNEAERNALADSLTELGFTCRLYGYSLQVIGAPSDVDWTCDGCREWLQALGFAYSERKGMYWRKWWGDEAA